MLQLNNLDKVMEAETISKNGASLKSQMSRSNFSSIFKQIAMIAIASTICVNVLRGQASVSVQAGVNFSRLSGLITNLLGHDDLSISMKPGIQFGVLSELPFGRSNFGMQTELLFSQLGTRMEEYSISRRSEIREIGTINMNCILLRPHIQYNYAFNNDLALTFHSGPHLAYGLWANYKYERFVDDKKVDGNSEAFFGESSNRGADLGIGLGAALTIQERYRVGVGYDFGLLFRNLSLSLSYKFGR